jgi:translation elongation factor EF-4
MQAQTLANFFLAFERDLTIIPVINKIDMDAADVPKVLSELKTALDIEPSEVSMTCA